VKNRTARERLPNLGRALWRMAFRLAMLVVLVLAINAAVDWAQTLAQNSTVSWAMPGLTLGLVLLYALLIAVPFMPGIEVGISILIMRGPEVAPLVWSGTTLGLTLAYFVGRMIPLTTLRGVFRDLRLLRITDMIDQIAPLSANERLELLSKTLPKRLGRLAIGFRYLTLAILINIPGNALIGGGGGIAFLAGLSKLFHPFTTLLTFALAVAPVPIAVWLFGLQVLTP